MEDKIQILSKMLKLKIRNNITEQEIIEFFEINKYFDDLTISIKFHPQQKFLLQQINHLLSKIQKISSLTLKINQFFDLNLDDFLIQIKNLQSLRSFSFKLNSDTEFSEASKISFGETLKHLENLENLTFYINSVSIPLSSNILDLKDAFQSLNRLTKISITTPFLPNQSYFIKKIFEGMSSQLQLQELHFSISNKFSSDENYFTFCQELKGLSNLKNLSIDFLFYTGVSKQKQKMLQKALLSLTNLETLNICLSIQNFKKAYLIRGIQNLTNLKHFQFSTNSNVENETIIKYLTEISQCIQLQSTQLELKIQSNQITEQQLLQINELVCLIPNLKSLKLDYPYSITIKFINLVNFIASLNCQKFLQNLQLSFYQICIEEQVSDQKLQQCKILISQLKEFKIRSYENQQNVSQPANKFFNLINGSSNIEKMDLNFSSYKQNNGVLETVQIKDIISNNKELQEFRLDLSNFYTIQQEEFERFFINLKDLNRIKTFKLKVNEIFSNFNMRISDSIGSLSNLQTLELTSNNNSFILFQNFQYYFQSIKALSMLEVLKLNFSIKEQLDIVFDEISNTFSNLQQLKTINLEICNESDQQLSKRINKINFPPKLKNFDLKLCKDQFNFYDIKEFLESFVHLKYLKYIFLDISFQKFEFSDVVEMLNIFSRLKSVTAILLSLNQFTSIYLLNLFQQLPLLGYLELGYIEIDRDYFYQQITRKIFNKKQIEDTQNQIENIENNNHLISYDELSIELKYPKEITQEDIQIFSQAITNIQVKKFKMEISSKNKVGVNFFQCLQMLTHLIQLEIIIYEKSKVSTKSIVELGYALQYFQHLRIFKIDLYNQNVQIDWNIAKQMFRGLKALQKIENLTIILRQSLYTEVDILENILSNINQLSSLTELSLEINSLSNLSKKGMNLQENLQNLNNLKSLSLNFQFLINNPLNIQKEFYQTISQINNINKLSITKSSKYTNILHKMKRIVIIKYYN